MKREDIRVGMRVKIISKSYGQPIRDFKKESPVLLGEIDHINSDHIDVWALNNIFSRNGRWDFLPEDLESLSPNEDFFLKYKEEK